MKYWTMVPVFLGLCVFSAHAGFKVYTPGEEQPSTVIRESAQGGQAIDVPRFGDMAEFQPGYYAVTFTADKGKQGEVRITDHTGKEAGVIRSGPQGGYAAGDFVIRRSGWYTISTMNCSGLMFRKGTPPPTPGTEAQSVPPAAVSISGLGPAMNHVRIEAGQYTATVTHNGRRNCIIEAHLLDDAATLHLADLLGRKVSQEYVHVRKSGEYVLETDADGRWTLELTPLVSGQSMPPVPAVPQPREPVPSEQAPSIAAPVRKKCPDIDMSGVEWSMTRVSENGHRSASTRPLGFRAGDYRFSYEYGGRGRTLFAVWMHTRRDYRDLLVNRIGSGKDEFPVRLECDDEVWFEIKAEGSWKIFFEKMR